jgi:hypothetical protein
LGALVNGHSNSGAAETLGEAETADTATNDYYVELLRTAHVPIYLYGIIK